MMSDLPPIDQFWMFSLIFAYIVGCLAILVLLGPRFAREVLLDVRQIFTRAGDDDGPGPTDPMSSKCSCTARHPASVSCGSNRVAEMLARDAEIQEVQ
jgi:hypothetical protein